MTISKLTLTTAAILALSIAGPASAKIATGSNVSDMTVVDSNGVTHNLSDFAGQKVVLEWTKTQKVATVDNDAVWLSIISSAPGKQGYVSGEKAQPMRMEIGPGHGDDGEDPPRSGQ